ncbi:MAG: hypothetical protein KDD40_05995 [Bdellovibrionales bacterium]|nr:hypothetical protein [Bdellovibrionales bacterium]
MLGENIDPHKANKDLVTHLSDMFFGSLNQYSRPLVLAFCGESGSGKSVIATATLNSLRQKNISVYMLQMDDYFLYPPVITSQKRQENLANVGPHEVDLNLMDEHILQIKNGKRDFQLREMHFAENYLTLKENDISLNLDVLLVEGTYTCLLQNVDKTIFLSRTYEQTHIHRVARMREPQTDLIEQVLLREHNIVKNFASKADIIINDKFELVYCGQ